MIKRCNLQTALHKAVALKLESTDARRTLYAAGLPG